MCANISLCPKLIIDFGVRTPAEFEKLRVSLKQYSGGKRNVSNKNCLDNLGNDSN